MDDLSCGTWASIGETCPIIVTVDGSDVMSIVIGGSGQHVELQFDAESARKLAMLSTEAVSEMDARFEREEAELQSRETAYRMVNVGCPA